MKEKIESLKKIPKEDRTTSYEILWGEKVVWMSTNDYIDAKRVASLLGKPYNESFDIENNLLELSWCISLTERKKITKMGLNGYAQRRTNKSQKYYRNNVDIL